MLGNMTLAATTAATKSSSSGLNIILIIVVLFGVLYFVMIRPQRNRQRKAQEQSNQVAPGSRVRTTAGMYATVVAVDGDDVILEVAPGVEVRYVKRSIMQVLSDGDESPAEPGYAAEDDADADDEAADHETTDEVADYEPAGHEAADHAGDETHVHLAGESTNGSAPAKAADESRTQEGA